MTSLTLSTHHVKASVCVKVCVCALPFTCRIFTNLNRWQTIDQRKWQLCEQFAFSCIMSKCIVDWLNTPNSRGPGTHDHLSWPTKTRWHGGENVPATSWTVFKLSQCVVYQHPLRRVLCSYRNGMWPTQEPPCRSMLWKLISPVYQGWWTQESDQACTTTSSLKFTFPKNQQCALVMCPISDHDCIIPIGKSNLGIVCRISPPRRQKWASSHRGC